MTFLSEVAAVGSPTMTLDMPYNFPSPAPTLDVYRPLTGAAPFRVVVTIFGGGWAGGDRHDGAGALHLAQIKAFLVGGLAVANVSYRLSGEASFPAAVEDVKRALRWLRRNGSNVGIDADRCGVWGASSGGHLAILAGLTGAAALDYQLVYAHDQVSCAVKSMAASSAPYALASWDADALARGYGLYGGTGFLCPSSVLSQFLGEDAGAQEAMTALIAASPYTYADLHGGRPIFLQAGSLDSTVPDLQALEFADELSRRGARVEYASVPAGHNDGAFLDAPALAQVVSFFQRTL